MIPYPKPVKREAKPRRPLKRSWIKRKPPRRLKRAGSDPARLAWVRTQRCLLYQPSLHMRCECWGGIHPHHAIHRSQGGKDDAAVPLCFRHHRAWHDHDGVFKGLSRLERFAWAVRAIAATQAAYEAR